MGRTPTTVEAATLTAAIDDSRAFYRQDIEAAKKLVSIGASEADAKSDEQVIELAALTSVMQIVLNADEFMTRE